MICMKNPVEILQEKIADKKLIERATQVIIWNEEAVEWSDQKSLSFDPGLGRRNLLLFGPRIGHPWSKL
jgi:hypothetical protein